MRLIRCIVALFALLATESDILARSCSLLLAGQSVGQSVGQDSLLYGERAQQLSAVVVTVPRLHQRDLVPAQQLSGEQLRRMSLQSVADALRYFSGLQVKDYGGVGGLKTVNVRSLGSQHLGVFYDGVQLGNAQNGVVDLGRFSLDNMEFVRLYQGHKTSFLQSAKDFASAHAIYMQTRRPHLELGQKGRLSIGLEGGSFSTIRPKGLWEQLLSRSVRLSLSAEGLYSSGHYPFTYHKAGGYRQRSVRENGDIRAARAELALWAGDSPQERYLKLYLYSSERGYPGASLREEPGVFRNQDRQWDTNFFVQARRKWLGSRHQTQLSLKYAYDYLRYLSDPRKDVTTLFVDNRYRQQEAYLSLAHSLALGAYYNLSLAQDLQYNSLRANLHDFTEPWRAQSLSALSLSYSRSKLKLQASTLYTYTYDYSRQRGQGKGRSFVSPSLSLSYEPWGAKGLGLRAYYKQSYRLPSFSDLYYTIVGTSPLMPEESQQYNVGLYLRGIKLGLQGLSYDLQADTYYNKVQNKIVAMPTDNQFRWTMRNFGFVDIYGFDSALALAYKRGRAEVKARLSYSYQQALEHSDVSSPNYGGQLPYAPRHSGSLVLELAHSAWFVNYSFVYTGERYFLEANRPEYHIQPWYTQDLSLGHTWRLGRYQLKSSLHINNLFNQQYEVVKNYPMPGINLQLKTYASF